ncbi:unnamed protein product [Amoebophrya sp. A120]|nr:unnamed protein product [Amoebophrya sp. A120]|eukprot:GSA120T00002318001.1
MLVQARSLEQLAVELLKRSGSTATEAGVVAANLVESNLKGVDSHGVGYLPRYVRSALSGNLNVNAPLKVLDHDNSTTSVSPILQADGDLGFGQVQGRRAMRLGIELAKNHGVALVALKNCHHLGRIGSYAEQCAGAGICSIHFTNVAGHQPLVAASRGGDARLGTNPFTIGCPRSFGLPENVDGDLHATNGKCDDSPPIVLDYATSAMALGKVREYLGRGEELPNSDIVLDAEGRPTKDPKVMFPPGNSTVTTASKADSTVTKDCSTSNDRDWLHPNKTGALLPFADHKGYALSFLCEILGAVFSGGNTIHPKYPRDQGLIINSMLTLLFDPTHLRSKSGTGTNTTSGLPGAISESLRTFQDEIRSLTDFMKQSAPRPGETHEAGAEISQVLVPGELEAQVMAQRLRDGIPLSAGTLTELLAAGGAVGIEEPTVMSILEGKKTAVSEVSGATSRGTDVKDEEEKDAIVFTGRNNSKMDKEQKEKTRYVGPSNDALSDEQRLIQEEILRTRPRTGLSGPFGPWLASPGVAETAQRLGKAVRYDTDFKPRQSECLILLTAAWTRSEKEWSIHEPEALQAGVPQPVLEFLGRVKDMGGRRNVPAILAELDDLAADGDGLLLRIGIALLQHSDLDDDLYAAGIEAFGEKGMVELVSIVGYYQYVALTLNVFRPPV